MMQSDVISVKQTDSKQPTTVFKTTLKVSAGIFITLFVLKILLPNTGPLVLLDEFCLIALIFIALAGSIVLLFTGKKLPPIKDCLYIVPLLLILLYLLVTLSGNFILDLTHGAQNVHLTQCEIDRSHSRKAAFLSTYYLKGVDSSGETLRFVISSQDYYRLLDQHGEWRLGGWNAVVYGYPNSGRVIRLH